VVINCIKQERITSITCNFDECQEMDERKNLKLDENVHYLLKQAATAGHMSMQEFIERSSKYYLNEINKLGLKKAEKKWRDLSE
jgi:hypothetical protein